MKYTAAVIAILVYGLFSGARAQVRSEKFIGFRLQGGDSYNIRAASDDGNTPTFESYQDHSGSGELGYGWFYKDNRSVYFGLTALLSHGSSPNGKQWNNGFGFTIQKTNYKNLYDNKIYFSLGQDLDYRYNYTRIYQNYTSIRNNPSVTGHTLDFSLKPGIFYRYNRSVAFTAQLELLGLELSMIDYYGGNKTTRFNYTIFSDYTFASIQAGVLWFPFASAENKP